MIRTLFLSLALILRLVARLSSQTPDPIVPAAADSLPPGQSILEEEFDLEELDTPKLPPSAPIPIPVQGSAGGRPAPEAGKKIDVILVLDAHFKKTIEEKPKATFGTASESAILRLTPHPRTVFFLEMVRLHFWEFFFQPFDRFAFRIGKLPLPFPSLFQSPVVLGLRNEPFAVTPARQFLVPEIWTEYGVNAEILLVKTGRYSLQGRLSLSNGLQGREDLPNRTVDFSGSSANFRDNNLDKALGVALRQQFFGKYSANFFWYTSKWGPDAEELSFYKGDRLHLTGADLRMEEGALPWRGLDRVAFHGAFALARTLAMESAGIDWHTKQAGQMEWTFQALRPWLSLQWRLGNYDDSRDVLNSRDLITHDFALIGTLRQGIYLVALYTINQERVNGREDDALAFKFMTQL